MISELADRIDLTAVVDVHLDRAQKLAAEHGGTAFTSLTDALQAVDIDVVSVCTPTGRHGELAISRRSSPASTSSSRSPPRPPSRDR